MALGWGTAAGEQTGRSAGRHWAELHGAPSWPGPAETRRKFSPIIFRSCGEKQNKNPIILKRNKTTNRNSRFRLGKLFPAYETRGRGRRVYRRTQTKLNRAPFARSADPRPGARTGCRYCPPGTSPGKRPPSPPLKANGARPVPPTPPQPPGKAPGPPPRFCSPCADVGGEAAASQRGGPHPSAREPEPLC